MHYLNTFYFMTHAYTQRGSLSLMNSDNNYHRRRPLITHRKLIFFYPARCECTTVAGPVAQFQYRYSKLREVQAGQPEKRAYMARFHGAVIT